ncbi:MAG: IS4 family transposase [Thermomicrobiales bacterium]
MSTARCSALHLPIVGEIETFLRDAVQCLTPDPTQPIGRGRPLILPALCLWGGVLVSVLRGFRSQIDLWRLLTQQGLWEYPRFPVTDQAVYNRLEDAGTAPLEELFRQVTTLLHDRLTPLMETTLAPFAVAVVALDESTLDQMARLLPALRDLPSGDARLLGGTLTGRFDLRAQQWQRVAYRSDAQQNEKVAAREMVTDLPPGTLIVADLGYFGFQWFDDLTDADYWWVSRMRAGTSYEIVHIYYQQGETFDGIVWLGKHRSDRAKHAVRLVRFRVGEHLHVYLTNVRDPAVLPMAEIARVYGRRWDFEMAIKLVKRELGLHLLWSVKPAVIAQQMWAALIIAQILHALRFEVARRADADIWEVSLSLLVRWMPRFAAGGEDPVAVFVERGRAAGFIRPSRRIIHSAPEITDTAITPLPMNTVLERTPRHAARKCDPRRGTIICSAC